jgi:hypothetical protein
VWGLRGQRKETTIPLNSAIPITPNPNSALDKKFRRESWDSVIFPFFNVFIITSFLFNAFGDQGAFLKNRPLDP